MSTSNNRKRFQVAPGLVVSALILALSAGAAVAQSASQAQGVARRAPEELAYAYAFSQAVGIARAEGTQVPQDIRIMQRIVSTALGEVEAPELPDALTEDTESTGSRSAWTYDTGASGLAVVYSGDAGGRAFSISGRDVTGFQMQGYG